jgi:pimeloyl-ACP methyl ester carboxylesterase
MLDVIDKGAASRRHPHPLLFVHGAWHAGWCWPLRACSVSDYVSDICSVVETLSPTPVLVGHSVVGFVVFGDT